MKKLIFIGLFCFCSIISFGQNKLDSVLATIKQLTDSAKVDSVIRLSRLSSIADEGKSGLLYANWALTEARANGFKDLIPKARFYLASAYDDLGLHDSCAINYDRALVEMKGTKHENWDIHVYRNSISNYRNTGQYEKALNSGYNALNYFEELNDTVNIAWIYTSIGYVYDRMQEFEEAIKWHRKSLRLYQINDDMYMAYFVKGRIGVAYDDLAIYDSAHFYNLKALNYHIIQNDSFSIGQVSSNIGNTYIKQERWSKALEYLEPAYQIGKVHGDYGSFAIAAINLGNTHTNLGNYKKANEVLEIGLQSARMWGGRKFESEAYYRLHELFEKQQQFDSSLYYYKKHKSLEDTLYGLKKAEQIANMKTKYETEKKEQQIELQKISLLEKERKLESRQRTIFLLILISLLIIVVSVTAYKRIKAKKNAELQRLIIQEQERGLKAIFNAQEEERKRISKDLHDGVGQQLSGLKMAFQKLSGEINKHVPEKKEEIEKLTQIVSESADEIRSISHQMMPRALIELGLIDALEDMLSKSLGVSDIRYEFEHYGIEERLDERREVSLYRITQELINNIIKHSDANQVNVHLFKNKDRIILIVEDNGKGIYPANKEGHGLMNIKSRVNTLKGDVNLEPSPNSGTLATIRIPL